MKRSARLIMTCFLALCASSAFAQQVEEAEAALPISNTPSADYYEHPLANFTIAQQRAWFAAQQNMYRQEWYNWMGYSPLRPSINASYMASGSPRYFIPSRGVIVNTGAIRSWYW